ncbi:hypothetical protein K435DRAFT_597751, partial [Dendrothele bispora CBS 962.96]
LLELRKQVADLDNRYWQRHFERMREQKSTSSSSDNKSKKKDNSSTTSKPNPTSSISSPSSGNSSGNQSGSGKNTSGSSNSSSGNNSKKPYADKLGKDRKLTQAERERRKKFNLCAFCGGNHKIDDCNKRKKAQEAHGRA